MFIDALNKCGVAASETVFIDDQIENQKLLKSLNNTTLIAANPLQMYKPAHQNSIVELLD